MEKTRIKKMILSPVNDYGIICILLLILFMQIVQPDTRTEFNLVKGKNNFSSAFFSPLYASDLILFNPDIQTISFIDDDGNPRGYVNLFGGIGENFEIVPNKNYEITVRKNLTIYLQ